MRYFIFTVLLMCCCISSTNAATYSSTANLFENSYSNNLIDMAVSQIDNFSNKSFVIFQTNTDYYLVASNKKDVTVTGNRVVMNNSDIVRVIRTYSGTSYVYSYSSLNESSTTINLSNIVISNLDTNYSVSSTRFDDYYFKSYLIKLCMFIVGLIFAIFLVKGRSHV